MSEQDEPVKARKQAIQFDNVARDLQWRRRCQQEELNSLDCYAGPSNKKKTKVFQERADRKSVV